MEDDILMVNAEKDGTNNTENPKKDSKDFYLKTIKEIYSKYYAPLMIKEMILSPKKVRFGDLKKGKNLVKIRGQFCGQKS